MSKINHINLSVSNMQKSIEFYNSLMFALGFKEGIDESGDWGSVRGYKGENIELEIIHENHIDYKKFNRYVGLNHIAFEVATKEKVDEIYQLVKNLGVEITREPQKYPDYTENYYAFYFRDPDGVPLEVAFT